jgi:predicted MarR family transcription regulator
MVRAYPLKTYFRKMVINTKNRAELLTMINREGNRKPLGRIGQLLFSEKYHRKVVTELEILGLIETEKTSKGIFGKVTHKGNQLIMDFKKEEILDRLIRGLK